MGGAKRNSPARDRYVVETCEENCSTIVGYGVYVGTPVLLGCKANAP